MKLIKKIHITGKIILETGMHIGGSEETLEIGGIDQSVVKDKNSKLPYIPGSSLKGKLRDLLARKFGYEQPKDDIYEVFILFGEGADKKSGRSFGKLIVRDAFMFENKNPNEVLEDKAENTIDRVSGKAQPRHLERVVKDTAFAIDMVLDIYDKLKVKVKPYYRKATNKEKKDKNTDKYKQIDDKYVKDNNSGTFVLDKYKTQKIDEKKLIETVFLGFKLLEYDYLGGSGTRGYGKVRIDELMKQEITFEDDGTVDYSDKKNLIAQQNEN